MTDNEGGFESTELEKNSITYSVQVSMPFPREQFSVRY